MQDASFGVLTGNNVATKFVKAGGIIFREGATPASRMVSIVFSVVLLVSFLGVLVFGVVSGEFLQDEYGWLGIPLVLLFVAILSGILWRTLKSEQKSFAPQAIPERCLPPAPR